MTHSVFTFRGGLVFDGRTLNTGYALRLENGVVTALDRDDRVASAGFEIDLNGDILAPGYVDLQVNGGDGLMFNDDPSPETLRRMAAAHRRLGTEAILPTLITDTRELTLAAIDAVEKAVAELGSGILGIHTEGPHLSLARKGAHDPALIRPMTNEDLETLVAAASRLPVLMVTIAPENVTLDQAATLAGAGIVLSLGHSDADYDTCLAYQKAGVRCVTHLFNAMRQLGNREPGVVGAALDSGGLSAGLIADGIHVHPAAMRAAFAAKRGPGEIFLVTDAMAPAGTDIATFELNGRTITRTNGRLTLADGTLAGADLDLTRALNVLVNTVGLSLEQALRAATSIPAAIAGFAGGRLGVGSKGLVNRIGKDLASCVPAVPSA
ncbi:MAG: N-acetylglucosamine-6-phosphate deacetylase [Alphaproteobacteria bacterium]|nr:N-acetylglucosamine-6-phosphate deacetylase [Alphaproteobacteria bacterium]